jgi:4-hydroxy-2-oxoheptanedioate aldolase
VYENSAEAAKLLDRFTCRQFCATTDPKNVLTNPMMFGKIRLLEKMKRFSLLLEFEMVNIGLRRNIHMRPNKIRLLLNEGKPTFGTHVHSTWPPAIEALGHSGQFDYVEFVAEYTPYTLPDLENICRAAELYGLSSMIKVDQSAEHFWAQRGIGAGFQSVLFTDIRSAEDAANCVRIVRPETPGSVGTYGVKATRITYMGQAGSPAYIQALNDIVIAIMIEKKPAVDQLSEILSVPGIDMIQWGPSDFSMSYGKSRQGGAEEIRAIERKVIETALDMGIQPRAEIGTFGEAKRYLEMGVRHFCMGTDVGILYKYWKEEGAGLRNIVEGFSSR